MDQIAALNSIDKRYSGVKKPTELSEGAYYSCENIRKITSTDYGTSYLIESDDFKMYLPKRFNVVDVIPFIKDRKFRIIGWMKIPHTRDKKSPLLEFTILRDEEIDRNGRRVDGRNHVSSSSCPNTDYVVDQNGIRMESDPVNRQNVRTSSSTSSSSLVEERLTIVRNEEGEVEVGEIATEDESMQTQQP